MRMFVSVVPLSQRRVTIDNGVSLHRRGRLCAGPAIRLAPHTRAKQKFDLFSVRRGLCTVANLSRKIAGTEATFMQHLSSTFASFPGHLLANFTHNTYEFKGHVSTSHVGKSLGTRLVFYTIKSLAGL